MWKILALLVLSPIAIQGTSISDVIKDFLTYTSLISIYDDQDLFCTGAVLSSRAFLVAASCLENQKLHQNKLKAKAGFSTNKSDHRIRDVVIHPNYKSGESGFDIALLYAEESYVFSTLSAGIQSYSPNLDSVAVGLIRRDPLDFTDGAALTTSCSENDECASPKNIGCVKNADEDAFCPSHFGALLFDQNSFKLVGVFSYKPQENCSREFTRADFHEKWIREEITKQENYSTSK